MRIARALTLGLALFSMPLLAASGPNGMDAATEAKLNAALAGPQRAPANRARDQYRHPAETLKFFGLKQDMAVMEIWPSGGWWTEFLAPVLAEKGRYVAAAFDPDLSQEFAQATASFKQKLTSDPKLYGKAEVAVLMPASGKITPVPANSMDLVLTFRNIHNWMADGSAKAMFDAMYASLKPGGYLGVEEHRAPANSNMNPARTGYVREDVAIKLAEDAGFKLVSKSEVNANPKDTKDYPGGVWTLPPTFAEGDKDHAKYAAIGESDRFTMLFQKPMK